MATFGDGNNVVLGRGRVYFDRFTTGGVKTGMRMLGNVSRFEISETPEKLEMKDFSQASAPTLKSVVTDNAIEINMTLHEFVKENLAIALLGTDATGYTQAATPVVDETLTTSVVKGRIYRTAKRQIGSITVKKSPSTVLVLGTDYAIEDANAGLVRILPGSVTVSDGDGILISYTPVAITTPGLDKIIGGAQPNIEGELTYISENASGPQWEYQFWKVAIAPDGVLSLIGEQFAEMPLKAEALSDSVNHPTEPYFIAVKRA